jgi:hypothetical protein
MLHIEVTLFMLPARTLTGCGLFAGLECFVIAFVMSSLLISGIVAILFNVAGSYTSNALLEAAEAHSTAKPLFGCTRSLLFTSESDLGTLFASLKKQLFSQR